MTLRLPLGRGEVGVTLPAGITPELVLPQLPAGADLDVAAEARALARELPMARPAAEARVLVVVPDRTRPFPGPQVVPPLLETLIRERGVVPAHLTVAVASGTHLPSEADLAPAHLGALPAGVRLHRHDCDGPWVDRGSTPAGTPARIDPCLAEADAVAAVGGIAFHYFAGFGGGPKLLFPGLAERSAIAANHRRSLAALPPGGLAPGVEPGRLDGNPVAEDLRDVARLLPHAHHLTLWRDAASGRVFGRRWSDLSRFPEVCAAYAEGRRAGAPGRADVVVASAGGWPRDIDVVQAHKALFHATRFAREDAFVLLLAACEEGIGSHALARWLASPDLEALEQGARARYDLNAQTAVSLATLARRFRVRWIGSTPVPDLVRFGMEFTPDPSQAGAVLADAVTRAAAGAGAAPRVVVLPRASEVLPALAGPGAGP